MDAFDFFRKKKITQMGLGLLGRGVGDARYMAEQGAELIVTDLKNATELSPSVNALTNLPITFVLGEHRLEDFRGRDLVVKGPKTPLDSPYIAAAQEEGTHVTMSTALFARFARERGARIVGITGTRGKTTTTAMIGHILTSTGAHVLMGGNLRGVSTLSLLPNVTADTICVLELDSWQLQGFRAENLSPDVAVFTTFFADHQDYYPDMDTYLADKAEIFLHQRPDDTFVLGASIERLVQEQYAGRIPVAPVIARPEQVPAETLLVLGEHNRENAACALLAVAACGVSTDQALGALRSFKGVEGRLEFLGEKRGIQFYNDTTSTTPEATLAALFALATKDRSLILIMGGSDKGLDMGRLLVELPRYVKRLIMLSGTGTSRVLEYLPGASVYDSLSAAFDEAVRSARAGDTILLSPAFASFGMFTNEYERGDQFRALYERL